MLLLSSSKWCRALELGSLLMMGSGLLILVMSFLVFLHDEFII